MTDYVSKYTLRFNDLASKGFFRATAAARGLTRGLGKAGVAAGVISGLAVGAAVALTNSVAARADEFGKLARQVDFSAQSLQNLEFIANRQGASWQSVQGGIQTFTKRMGEFRSGTGALYGMLNKLDPVFAKQLAATTDNQEAYEMLLGKIGEIPDAQQQAALAAAAVSKQGARDIIRMVDGGQEAIQALIAQSEKFRPPLTDEQIAVAEQYSDSMFNAGTVLSSIGDIIGTNLMPILIPLFDKFVEFVSNNRELINSGAESFFEKIATAVADLDFEKIASGASSFITKVGEIGSKITTFVDKVGGFGTIIKTFLGLFVVGKITGFVAGLGPLVSMIAATGPIGLGLAAVVAAGVLVYQNWDLIKEKSIVVKRQAF